MKEKDWEKRNAEKKEFAMNEATLFIGADFSFRKKKELGQLWSMLRASIEKNEKLMRKQQERQHNHKLYLCCRCSVIIIVVARL